MKTTIKKILKTIDLYDYFLMFNKQYFKTLKEKDLEKRLYDFYSSMVGKEELCFDIGANYGNRTEIFLKIGARVVAVEPQPEQAKFLERRFKNNIILEKKAIGSVSGKSLMYISADNPLSSLSSEWISEVKRARFKHVSWDNKIEVEITTLDDLILKFGIPHFCKIDVEGYEYEVIKGLTHPIRNISFEYTIPEFTDRAIDCINYLNKLGKIICNYSPGETLKLGLTNWLPANDFIEMFRNLPSKGIIDGDVYIKYLDM